MNGKGLIEAVAYFRTSSATNVGETRTPRAGSVTP